MRPKKRLRTEPASAPFNSKKDEEPDEESVADEEPDQESLAAAPSFEKQKKGWKPVQMTLDMIQAFETEGGVYVEEMDEAGVTYGDAGLEEAEVSGEEKEEKEQTPDPAAKQADAVKVDRKKKKRAKAKQAAEPSQGQSSASKSSTAQPAAPAKSLNVEHRDKGAQEEEVQPQEALAAKLPAWAPFGLHALLMAGLLQLKFDKPTEVQARCLTPAILQRKDIVGAAETGSGKTLAFGLPILHHTLHAMDAAGETAAAGSRRPPADAVSGHLRALVVLPTRELAVQVQSHLNAAAQQTSVRAQCVVGGMSSQKQRRLLRRKPAVVVGTPGRIFALLGLSKEDQEERCDWFRDGLRGLRHLVLDEADRLVESGHFKELYSILSLVYDSLERSQQLQTFVFSATLTLDPRIGKGNKKGGWNSESKVDKLMRRMQFRDARAVHLVDLTRPEEETAGGAKADAEKPAAVASSKLGARLPAKLLFHEMECTGDKDREAFLVMWLLRRYRWVYMLSENGLQEALGKGGGQSEEAPAARGGKVVLFVNAISSVLRLSSVLSMVLEAPSARRVLSRVAMGKSKDERGKPSITVDVLGLHSRMRQKDRLRRIEEFREKEHAVLVCTDIAARGLDVPGINAVIHYHPPRSPDVFVHRSGRTARAGREGESIAVTGPGDATQWVRIYRAAGIEKDRVEDVSPTAFELAAAREAARLAADLESKIHRTKKERTDTSWMKRTAEAAELVLSEDEADKDKGRDMAPKRALWGLYQQMLARVRRLPKRQGAAPLPRRRRRW